MDTLDRFGLPVFKTDRLHQMLSFLKGLQLELEICDFNGAKQYYLEALAKPAQVNHKVRKATLLRLISINRRMGLPKDSPEKALLSRYYIKQSYVQILLDASSFINTKTLTSVMILPKMIFKQLGDKDYFGMKVLKNGFNARIPSSTVPGTCST